MRIFKTKNYHIVALSLIHIFFTAILNLFFLVGDGEPIFSLWFLHIYREGVAMAIMMAVRIMCLIAGTSLLTYTTSPIELTDAIEVLMGPLKKIKVPVHELSLIHISPPGPPSIPCRKREPRSCCIHT